jgi:hypothetical protein
MFVKAGYILANLQRDADREPQGCQLPTLPFAIPVGNDPVGCGFRTFAKAKMSDKVAPTPDFPPLRPDRGGSTPPEGMAAIAPAASPAVAFASGHYQRFYPPAPARALGCERSSGRTRQMVPDFSFLVAPAKAGAQGRNARSWLPLGTRLRGHDGESCRYQALELCHSHTDSLAILHRVW